MKEIIIDGVNVAECGAYKDSHCIDKTSIMFCDTNLCSNYPYCYYKQLKRLEQENEALKQTENEAKEIIAELKTENEELEKENSLIGYNLTLKEKENEELRQVRKDLPDIQSPYVVLYRQIKQENEELKEDLKTRTMCITCEKELQNCNLRIENEKLKQALEEIREIAKMDCGDCQYSQDCNCNFQECEEYKIDDILKKINEVLK